MIPILILAAGQSSRMRGADKLLEDAGGEPLLRRQVKIALGTGAPVYVALPQQSKQRLAVIADLNATVLHINQAQEGMSGTMRGAVAQLPAADAFMVVLADLVMLESTDLSDLLAARLRNPDARVWRGATSDGTPGHPVIFDASLRPLFERLRGDTGAAAIIAENTDRTFIFKFNDQRAVFDLDTREDWAAWRAISR